MTIPAVMMMAASLAGGAPAGNAGCARACLAGVADTLLASIVAHDASRLPLAAGYAATENLVPSTPAMMTAWRTITAIKARRYTIDSTSQQLFVAASVAEQTGSALLYGRIALASGRIREIELYINRAQAEGGSMFDPDGMTRLPPVWQATVAPARRPSRADLLAVGRSLFDPSLTPPPADPACVIVETGRVARLTGEMQASVTQSVPTAAPSGRSARTLAKVSCEIVAHRPKDPAARVTIVDEEQGEVVSLAQIRGIVSANLMTIPPESIFLPDNYYARYLGLQTAQRAKLAPNTTELRPMPTTAAVVELARVFDGRLQGFQRFIHVTPEGAISPWVRRQ